MGSMIAEHISSNESWADDFEALGIKVKDDGVFMMFNYRIDADFSSPLVREARGIVLDAGDLSVACRGFDKFFNAHEQYAASIDWDTARVQEKVDGSIVKLFWNRHSGEWQWATNGVVDARDASLEGLTSRSFYEVIMKSVNLGDVRFDDLDRGSTYIFELTGPENRVVVPYPVTSLWHLGTRDNRTGEEMDEDIGVKRPREFPLRSLGECVDAIAKLNAGIGASAGYAGMLEGFVVVDGDYNRIKVKSPEYVMLSRFSNGDIYNKGMLLRLMRSDDFDVDDVVRRYPGYEKVFDYYDTEIRRVYSEVDEYVRYARSLFEELGGDRKKFALRIKDDAYAPFGFQAISRGKTTEQMLGGLSDRQFERLVVDYRDAGIGNEDLELV